MITSAQMLTVLKARMLQLIPIRSDRDGNVQWTCRTIDGTRATGSNQLYITPEEAVEAADLNLSQAELRERERSASTIIEALEKGKYSVKKDSDGTFLIVKQSGSVSSITGRSSLVQAVIDAESEGLGK